MALRTISGGKTLARNLGLGFGHMRELQTFSLPELPYHYGALEPAISREIMQLHHQKHQQTYVTNYNKGLEQLDAAMDKGDASNVVKLQSAIKFNGGGHINHSIFWKNLAPISEGGGEPPKGSLAQAIDTQFGSLEVLMQKINSEGIALQGSGWVWLALDKELKGVLVETTANQYKNVRPDYLKNVWKVMNWKYASEVYEKVFLEVRDTPVPRESVSCECRVCRSLGVE